jgi:OFA family oxalate/formate antiporter-like MFS transporter
MDKINSVRVFGMDAVKGRWLFIACGFTINICLGSVYSYSVFRKPVEQLFSCGTLDSGWPYTFFLAFWAIFMFFGRYLLEKLGPKIVALIGGIIVGIGWILSGIIPGMLCNIWTLVITYGVIAGSGVGLAYGAIIAVANKWFPDKKGLAVGLTLAGFGGAPFVTANIAGPLIASNGPLVTFLILGIAFLVINIILSLLIKFPPVDWKPANWQPSMSNTAHADIDTAAITKTSAFWGLFMSYAIGCLAGLMAIGIASPVGTEIIKLDTVTAAMLVGIFAIFNGAGRPLFGWLTDKITPRWASIISVVIILIASLLMLTASAGTTALYIACFSALWLCLGGWLAIAPTATTIFFGNKNYVKNYGVVFFAFGIGAILANFISGQSKDIFGNYNIAFIITAALAIVAIILCATLMRTPKIK